MQALIGLPDGPTICYLRLHYFSSEGTRAVTDAINMAEYWGAEGFIIDLRNNPGGAVILAELPGKQRLRWEAGCKRSLWSTHAFSLGQCIYRGGESERVGGEQRQLCSHVLQCAL